jgi:hypothetical protein
LKHVSKVRTTSLTSPPNLLVNKNIIEFFLHELTTCLIPIGKKEKHIKLKPQNKK